MLRTILLATMLAAIAAPVQGQAPACPADGARCITVSFHDTELREVTAAFVAFTGTSIVLGEGVGGRVTADIRNQPWDVALRAILEANGLGTLQVAPGLLRVEPLAQLAARAEAEPLVTRVFRLRYVPAASLAQTLDGVRSERGRIAVSEEANALIITDTAAALATMQRLIGHAGQ